MPVIINGTTGIDTVQDGIITDGKLNLTANSQEIKDAINATGSADIYACRAWVNFNGTGTVAIRSSGNVSSITDNGAGDYTVNFTTAMPDANYANVFGSNTDNANGSFVSNMGVVSSGGSVVTKTTSALRVLAKNQSWVGTDGTEINVAIFR
jgi:hypothetical protein